MDEDLVCAKIIGLEAITSQQTHNILTTFCHATNTEHRSDVDATFGQQVQLTILSVVLTMLLQRENRDMTFMFSQRRYYDVTFTTFDSKFTSEYIMNIVIAKSKKR